MEFHNFIASLRKSASSKYAVAASSAAVVTAAVPAMASPTVADLWTAVDISTISTQVLTILTAMVGIRLAYLVYKYVKRTMGVA